MWDSVTSKATVIVDAIKYATDASPDAARKALIGLSRNGDTSIRTRALEASVELEPHPDVKSAAIAATTDRQPNVRRAAAVALRNFALEADAAEALRSLVADADGPTGAEAVTSLYNRIAPAASAGGGVTFSSDGESELRLLSAHQASDVSSILDELERALHRLADSMAEDAERAFVYESVLPLVAHLRTLLTIAVASDPEELKILASQSQGGFDALKVGTDAISAFVKGGAATAGVRAATDIYDRVGDLEPLLRDALDHTQRVVGS